MDLGFPSSLDSISSVDVYLSLLPPRLPYLSYSVSLSSAVSSLPSLFIVSSALIPSLSLHSPVVISPSRSLSDLP
ncbi:hypothetical protein ACLOJK_031139 [Asimina triloba]